MKTYSAKPKDINRQWYTLDASEAPLGRVATRAASLLIGKTKTIQTKHIDSGDFVIIINSDNLVVTGNKKAHKTYYSHSGYPGGLKEKKLAEVIQTNSSLAIISAVKGMLPVNKLRDGRLKRLKVYKGPEHNHTAQQPQTISLKKGNQ